MTKTRRYNIEGAVLDVFLRLDEQTGREFEDYPDLVAHPVYTPAGERVLLTIEDACPDAKLRADGMRDCGSCLYYRQVPGTLLGVCGHEKRRRG